MIRRTVTAFPTMLRVGFSGMVAYRAEFFVWVLTATMPLIMMALMTAVAGEAPIQGLGSTDFVAYYLVVLLVRQFTATWVVWEMTEDIKRGMMGLYLLRPVPPVIFYATENLGAIPLRGVVAIPLMLALLFFAGPDFLGLAPLQLLATLAAVAMAWFISFSISTLIGSLSFFIDSATSIHNVYYGLYMVLSGYLLPLSLFPKWMLAVNDYLPFRYVMSVPVELATGRLTGTAALHALGGSVAWCAGAGLLTWLLWRAGLKRYAAFGG